MVPEAQKSQALAARTNNELRRLDASNTESFGHLTHCGILVGDGKSPARLVRRPKAASVASFV